MEEKPDWAHAIDAEDTEALRAALLQRRKRSLIRTGEEANVVWRDGTSLWTPLGYAITHSKLSTAHILLEEGESPSQRFLETRYRDSSLDEAGLDGLVLPAGYESWTPLSKAIQLKHADLVRALLARGADAQQEQVMELAISNNSAEIVQLLVEHGGLGGKMEERDFLAYAAAHKCHHRIVGVLLEHGAPSSSIKALDFSNQSMESLPLWLLRCQNLKKVSCRNVSFSAC
jgi:ankyrin repeat protein